jgi:hypothetical protein
MHLVVRATRGPAWLAWLGLLLAALAAAVEPAFAAGPEADDSAGFDVTMSAGPAPVATAAADASNIGDRDRVWDGAATPPGSTTQPPAAGRSVVREIARRSTLPARSVRVVPRGPPFFHSA